MPTPLNYTDWRGRPWRVDQNLVGATSDVEVGDTLGFTLGATSTIQLTSVTCTHGTGHNAGKWIGVCVGSRTTVVGITPGLPPLGGEVFKIECTVKDEKHILTCSVLCDCDKPEAPGGGVCWTATDG